MGGHFALTGATHSVAFFGVCQDDCWLAHVIGGRSISSVNFDEVMPAAFQAVDLVISHPLCQFCELFVLSKECVAIKAAIFCGEGLHLSVDRVCKSSCQGARDIAGKQTIPIATPNELDDVPACAGKEFFELVDDSTVTAHRAIQALKIAIDYPDQIVEAFAGGQRQGAHGFRLIHFAVTKHAPDFAGRAVKQIAMAEVAHEARMIDRTDWPNPHRPCGKLPEIRHEPRVRVAR